MANKKPKEFNFEKSFDKLNQLVEKMEQGDIPLEQSLKNFETGIGLIRECQTALSSAEQKVQILMQKNGEAQLQDFNNHE
ncbi:MAG: exodeoxyribonuclease VII small subunit [Gammaproteobacteria bacterium]|nr:exodeoxyribonuclease VII small subunit [Gammaproteobacteria bacterium]MCH9744114.1 exodeoxyribonuclease VII small subunit [Gammaproteobacteria bacterium]